MSFVTTQPEALADGSLQGIGSTLSAQNGAAAHAAAMG